MFETSVVKAQAAVAPRRVGLLTMSVALHSLAAVAVIVISVASVEFPPEAPSQLEIFRVTEPVSLPPALGTPDGGAAPKPQPQPQTPKPSEPAPVTAPPDIPEEITPAETPSSNTSTDIALDGGDGTGTNPGPRGREDGVVAGIDSGEGGSIIGGGDDAKPREDVIYRVGAEVTAPRVLRRVEPAYPPAMIRAGINATVTVHCIIGRNGRVRDAKVTNSTFPMANQAVLDAVERWEFVPGMMRGQAVDTYFELTVRFTTVR